MRQRLDFIDEMRGFAILLVVAGHLIQFNGWGNPAFEFIYSFHMPLFFSISGYITHKVTNIISIRQYVSFIKKKTISLIVPLFTWSLIVDRFFLNEQWKMINVESIIDTIVSPGLWFLQILFVILLFYGLFNYIYRKYVKFIDTVCRLILSSIPIIIISVILVVMDIVKISFLMFSYAFYIGVMLAELKCLENFCRSNIIYAISASVFFILSCHWQFNGNIIDDLLKVIISTLAFIFFINVFTKFEFSKETKHSLQLFGRYSLALPSR